MRTRAVLVAIGAVLGAAVALAIVLPLTLGGEDTPQPSSGGPAADGGRTAFVPGATLGLGATRVTIKNTWGGPGEPNVVVSVGDGGAGAREAWTFVLDDGSRVVPVVYDWPNGEAYMRIERGVPAGKSVRALVYAPAGGTAVSFEFQ